MEITETEIFEGNEIIAMFMGLHFHKTGWVCTQHIDGNYECPKLKYHYEWDWLMPVVEKIEKEHDLQVSIYKNFVSVGTPTNGVYYWHGGSTSDSKIISVWYGIVEFSKWYTRSGQNVPKGVPTKQKSENNTSNQDKIFSEKTGIEYNV